MTSTGSDDLEDALRDARQRFVSTFSSLCDAIHADLVGLGTDGAARDRVLGVVHRLVGLAGTIGFPSVSDKAGILEDLLRDHDLHRAEALAVLSEIREAFAADARQEPEWSTTTPATTGSATILLVDDDDEQRRLTALALERGGYRVVALPAADTLIEAAREIRPDLIVLDVMMPGIDGHLSCRLLKSDPVVSGVPVMFCSSRSTIDERMAGLALGAVDYVSKPIDPAELLFRAKRVLDQVAAVHAPKSARPSGHLPPYEAFAPDAAALAASGPCAVALLRVDPESRAPVAAALAGELRRRDIAGEFDRLHLIVVFPDLPGRIAVDRLKPFIDTLAHAGTAVRAGVSASPVAGGFTLDALITSAEEALAHARFHGVSISQHGERASADAATSAKKHLLLLADDDPEVMRIVDAQMRSQQFETALAFDGEAALVAITSRRVDLVVLDLMLPKVTGFEILHRMRDLPEPRARVIVLSARGREEDITRAFDLGADDYLTKPFRPQELAARVVRLLR